ncbi:MAG: hypothetical protein ACP5HS_10270 [Anaerolineae bacterium]
MQLKPVIASYSGDAYVRMRAFLGEDVLALIGEIARSPEAASQAPADMLGELIEMHVLREEGDSHRLDTSVFLRDDIAAIREAVTPLARELAEHVLEVGDAFKDAPAELVLFLGGIIGLVQGLGRALQEKNVGVDWQHYGGRYARAKVDFDEVCDIYEVIGPDCLNKTILQGERYTAVFIGPGGRTFASLGQVMYDSDESSAYARQLHRFLVDAYAELAQGRIEHTALRAAAKEVGLLRNGRLSTAVITSEVVDTYKDAIDAVASAAFLYYQDSLPTLEALLRSTTPGRQGVPPANMMMNLWRYIRKLTARELYASGFLRDTVPDDGVVTVFHENDVPLLRRLLL